MTRRIVLNVCFCHIVYHNILSLYILLIKHENIFQDHIESEDSIMQSRRVSLVRKEKILKESVNVIKRKLLITDDSQTVSFR